MFSLFYVKEGKYVQVNAHNRYPQNFSFLVVRFLIEQSDNKVNK